MIQLRLLYCMMLFLVTELYAQNPNSNYVETLVMLESDIERFDDDDFEGDLEDMRSIVSYQYYDGLGRPTTNAVAGLNLDGNYIHTLQTYDMKGRPYAKWASVPGTTSPNDIGISTFTSLSAATYQDSYGFSTTTYDALDRIKTTTKPGEAWHISNKSKHSRFVTNAAVSVKHYAAPTDVISLTDIGYYPANSLTGEEITDEEGNTLTTFKDFQGKTILERRNGNNDTYYVYNDYGQLRYVLSPQYQQQGTKSKYVYEYRYDALGRMVKKILPGCDYIQYWYDQADRVQFMQDATLREKGLYRFFFYDGFGRLALQGVCQTCVRNTAMYRVDYTSNREGFFYTKYYMPRNGLIDGQRHFEKVCYYDNYRFLSEVQYFSNLSNSSALGVSNPHNAKGLLTGTIERVESGENILKVFYYDDKGRLCDTKTVTYKGGLIESHTEYTFAGKVSSIEQKVYSSINDLTTPEISSLQENHYDNRWEVLQSVDLTLIPAGNDSTTHTIQTLEYDGLGHISKVTRSGQAGSIEYAYDIHGWTTNINGGGFHEDLYYAGGQGTPCYNGNISSMAWRTDNDNIIRGYTFDYDNLNRLTLAEYAEGENLSDNTDYYTEQISEYTLNGAIKRLYRHGKRDDNTFGLVDNLTATYDGNKLQKVADAATPVYSYGAADFKDGVDSSTEYTYNGVGALTSDANKGIAHIEYDALNHPTEIQFTNGSIIQYIYSPDGEKLQTKYITAVENVMVPVNTTLELQPTQIAAVDSIEYVGNIVYHNGEIDKFLFSGGYVQIQSSQATIARPFLFFEGDEPTPEELEQYNQLLQEWIEALEAAHNVKQLTFHYYTQDHLGNNRVVMNEDGTIEQVTHYYPFGGVIADISTNQSLQPYKYNGKELDRMHGLDWYDYGARMYDPALPSWTSVDPMAERTYYISPYSYCENTPAMKFDPDGKFGYEWLAKLSHSMYNTFHSQQAGPIVENPDVKNNLFRYTYNTYSTDEDGGFVITCNYKFDDDIAEYTQSLGDVLTIAGFATTIGGAAFGVGEVAGPTMVKIGTKISAFGTAMQGVIDLMNTDWSGSGKEVFKVAVNKVGNYIIESSLNSLMPGVGDTDLGRKILRLGHDVKMIGVDKTIDWIYDEYFDDDDNNGDNK